MMKIVRKQIEILKNNVIEFKKAFYEVYQDESDEINDKISKLNIEINRLRDRMKKYSNKTGESYDRLLNEINIQIENLITKKKTLENELLTGENADSKLSPIVKAIESTEIDGELKYRDILQRAVIISKTEIVFIVVNKEIEPGLDLLNLPTQFNSQIDIQLRRQIYPVKFGIYINK